MLFRSFVDPRSSQIDIVQAVGRAIRKSAHKEVGTIVLPVLIPTTADIQNALDDSAFKSIWSILNALKSHDGELEEQLNAFRFHLGRTGSAEKIPDKVILVLPNDVEQIAPGFSRALNLQILRRSADNWEEWFGLLNAYVKIGRAHV